MNAISCINITEPATANRPIAGHANLDLQVRSKTIYNFCDIIGNAPAMQKVYHMVSRVAESNSTVLLLGETGTGKGLIADAIHMSSPRKNKQIVKVNCAAMPTNLIESELFGHERGAYTGAAATHRGFFEQAHGAPSFSMRSARWRRKRR